MKLLDDVVLATFCALMAQDSDTMIDFLPLQDQACPLVSKICRGG